MVSQPISYREPGFLTAYHINNVMDSAGWKRGPAGQLHLRRLVAAASVHKHTPRPHPHTETTCGPHIVALGLPVPAGQASRDCSPTMIHDCRVLSLPCCPARCRGRPRRRHGTIGHLSVRSSNAAQSGFSRDTNWSFALAGTATVSVNESPDSNEI